MFFGACADLHIGSKYHRPEELKDYAQQVYAAGGQRIFVAGDLLDGTKVYEGQEFELTHQGFDEQAQALIDTLPAHPGLVWTFIAGNHDASFHKRVGLEPGEALVSRASAQGRKDLHYLGSEDAFVWYGGKHDGEGILIELYHPRKAGAYALSYHLQGYINAMQPGQKPQLLISGHEHSSFFMRYRNVYALKPGTFQSQTPLMVRLRLMPALGASILRVKCSDDWSIRSCQCEDIPYFGAEGPRASAANKPARGATK